MILESLDDIECLQEQLYEDKTMMNSLLEDKQLHILLEVSFLLVLPNISFLNRVGISEPLFL